MADDIKIIFTDLDGTLLNSSREISCVNHACLEELGRKDIVRVIATGRSLFSYRRLFKESERVPADYLIFSTGTGILDLRTGELLYTANLARKDIHHICSCLQHEGVDFMVHHRVPDNHHFIYWGDRRTNKDFARRIALYQDYAQEFTSLKKLPDNSAQIIAIFTEDLKHFKKIESKLAGYQITRTTSPLDDKSIWMEISPPYVTKGSSAAWLCDHLGLPQTSSLGIGNDYNDLSLLQFTHHSYIVANSPKEMHRPYSMTRSNNDDGFYYATLEALGHNSG